MHHTGSQENVVGPEEQEETQEQELLGGPESERDLQEYPDHNPTTFERGVGYFKRKQKNPQVHGY